MSKVTKLENPVEKEMTPHLMGADEMVNDISFRLAQKVLDELSDKGLITGEEFALIRRENIRTFHPILADLMQK